MNTENVVESNEADASNASAETVVHNNVAAVIESAKAKGKPGRKVIPGSGLQRAKAIYERMHGAERSAIVAAFVADKIPKPSANTYYHLIKNGTPS